MNRLHALLLALFACGAAADDVTPQQFADGFAIQAPAGAVIYRIALPESVYRSAQRADLADMRVFNRMEEVVPHSIVWQPEAPPPASTARSLAFFALYGDSDRAVDGSMQIAIDNNGAIINMTPPHDATSVVNAYIVDTGVNSEAITGLDLEWQQKAQGSLSRIDVSSSMDITEWQAAGSATLVDMNQGGHRLQQKHIDLQQPLGRYLRLSWPVDGESLVLTAVTARLQIERTPEPRNWSEFSASPAKAPERGFVFDALAQLPVDSARVVLEQDNSLVQLRWYSRATPNVAWRELGITLCYRLNVQGVMLENTEMHFAQSRDRYWRVEVVDGDGAALGATPRLAMGWRSDELRFMARGEPPFQLAVGSIEVTTADQSVNALLGSFDTAQQDTLTESAGLGERQTLGGAAALTPTAPPTPWQRYLLWAVLIAAVLLLARMAQQLYRQMNTPAA